MSSKNWAPVNWSRWKIVPLACGLLIPASVGAQNSWTNPSSGDWTDASSWSLKVSPSSAQTVFLTNAGARTIVIDGPTAQSNPASLTVYDAYVGGGNTLFLNNAGTNAPLTIVPNMNNPWTGLTLTNGGAALSLDSAIVIGTNNEPSGVLRIADSGTFSQEGGFTAANTTYIYGGGAYNLTDGNFQGNFMDLIWAATVNQYSGEANLSKLEVSGDSSYNLYDGNLVTDSLQIDGEEGAGGHFWQEGGTNQTSTLNAVSPYNVSAATYTMNGGLLCTSNVFISGSDSGFQLNGGTHIVSNTLSIGGGGTHFTSIQGFYRISNGTLLAGSVVLGEDGPGQFSISGSTVVISNSIQAGPQSLSQLAMGSGTVTCENILTVGGSMDLVQDGGQLQVNNLLQFGGYYAGEYAGNGNRFPIYTFSGGTLWASNIELDAHWTITSAQLGDIINPGYFQMAGTLAAGNADVQFGRFILGYAAETDYAPVSPVVIYNTNAVIQFMGTNTRLAFAESSGELWTNSCSLIVTNWNGYLSGGGPAQLVFGSDQNGLTKAQLGQIQFANPVTLPAGLYPSTILPSGEVVPSAPHAMTLSQHSNTIVLTWGSGAMLQCATNIVGPYTDLTDAVSPYIENFTNMPQRFFRLKH